MIELRRTVRLFLSPDPAAADAPRANTFSAWPPPAGLDRYYELDVTCRGDADPVTGYFLNITEIDRAVRDAALPRLRDRVAAQDRTGAPAPLGAVLAEALDAVDAALAGVVASVALRLSPRLSLVLEKSTMHTVVVRQQYEFSAAHRLHAPSLSDERNRAVFGKCNNPAGHGHNYTLEVHARAPIDPQGRTLDVGELDQAVDRLAVDRLDHKHLNLDVPAFADRNPSVEHIAQVIWGWLDGGLPGGATLDEVRVWETGKTMCAYRGENRKPAEQGARC